MPGWAGGFGAGSEEGQDSTRWGCIPRNSLCTLEGIEDLQGPAGRSRGLERCAGPAFQVLILHPQAGRAPPAPGAWQTWVRLGLRVLDVPGPGATGRQCLRSRWQVRLAGPGQEMGERGGLETPLLIHSSMFAGVSW